MPRPARGDGRTDARPEFGLLPLEPRVLFAAGTPGLPVIHKLNLADVPVNPGVPAMIAAAAAETAAEIYTPTLTLAASTPTAVADVAAAAVAPFDLNMDALHAALTVAPMEFTPAAQTNPLVIELPTPDGGVTRFAVAESPIMAPELAAQFPDVRTYSGVGLDDATATLRLDFTPLGFHAQVLSPTTGAYYIDPYYQNDAGGTHVAYYRRDLTGAADAGFTFFDDDGGSAGVAAAGALPTGSPAAPAATAGQSIGSTLRTFRLAVAADGEYTQAVGGGTVAGAQAAIVTAINRVDGVYETELDVRLSLVANNASLIFTNPATDPYANNSGDSAINTGVIDGIIGPANYDVGHVFTTGSGGLAYVGVVGNAAYKGGGTTGKPNPTGDAFYIDYVAHEIGHQFGAQHTFNTAKDGNNREAGTAYEPGSGSTIMGYAGLEGTDDLQPHSDPYFLSASLDQIRYYLSTIPNVGASTATGNHAPTIVPPSNRTIPAMTPFVLTASATDPDGDVLTYDWEERDLGPATNLTTADNGSSPLFRTYPPTSSPSRTLPQLASVLSGANHTLAPTGGGYVERLYAQSRTSAWRVVVRDNRAGGGGVATADVTLTVVNTGASFAITSPNTAVTWTAGTRQTVTWDVAGTTGNGINAAAVNILLSTDGGQTFPVTLAAGVANDGSATFTLPTDLTATTAARIKIVPTNNVFFDVSDANFTLVVPVTTGTVTGVAFQDNNGSGIRDGTAVATEPGLVNVGVFLDVNHNNAYDPGADPTTTTDANGNYFFAAVPAGSYGVGLITPTADYLPTSAALQPVTVSIAATTTAPDFALFPTRFTGAANGSNAFTLNGGTGGITRIWENAPTDGPATYQIANSLLGSTPLTFAPSNAAGADALTLARPASPVVFLGGTGTDSLTLAAGATTFSSDLGAGTATLSVTLASGTAASFAASQHLASLTLQGSSKATLAPGAGILLSTAALSLSPTATLDLSDNDMLIDYTDPANSPLAAIRALVAAAATPDLTWTGPGITSSSARALAAHLAPGTLTTLAVAEAAAYERLNGPTFAGASPDDTAVLIKYTYAADATLDGRVSDADVDVLYAHYQDPRRRQDYLPFYTDRAFTDADFTFDGVTDDRDVELLSSTYDPLAPVL